MDAKEVDRVVAFPKPGAPRTRTKAPPPKDGRSPDTTKSIYDVLDHATQINWSRFTHGLSLAALAGAWFDWVTHLAAAPGKQLHLAEKAADKVRRQTKFALNCATKANPPARCIQPLPQDKRFSDGSWQKYPFNLIHQGFLLRQQWWHNTVTGVAGVSEQHERMLQFLTRQVLDMVSPSNFLLTNPELLKQTQAESGQNLIRGMQHFFEDAQDLLNGAAPAGVESFGVGRDVAVTPGRVIYRNRLIELIQYAPSTAKVRPEPILIVPAWIMKYYILDLSPENSLVRWLLGQGFTVFMISWKNPDLGDRNLTMDDYRRLGIMEALKAVQTIVPDTKVHAAGYCLGGTLLAIAAAAIAREDNDPFATLSFLASQVDFTDPGELQMFINESQLSFLDSVMWKQGYLDSTQMAGAFQMLRSNDLIWSRIVRGYLKGERHQMTDLMAWNTDGTRMPFAMHSEYLRKLYLKNDLAEGRFQVEGRPVAVSDIRTPIFAVGTERDHVAPWRSVYKLTALADTEVTFTLTSGGHNGGIVSEPGHKGRRYRIGTKGDKDRYVGPEGWLERTDPQEGSWWLAWRDWLAARSGNATKPPQMGQPNPDPDPFADAPGTYVLQR